MSVISNIKSPSTNAGNDAIFNPKSQLSNTEFMQLFLKQLEMQDPTNPMDTDKMLEQTSSLSTMEMNKSMQDTLNKLSQKLQSQSQFNTISAIGKMADTGNRYVNVTDKDKSKSFELYFGDDIQSGSVTIKDKQGNIVKTFSLDAHNKGILSFDWDLKDDAGNLVDPNTYEVTAQYKDPNGNEHKTSLGAYPIESIKFENGEALAKLGSKYIPFNAIKEIYEWQG